MPSAGDRGLQEVLIKSGVSEGLPSNPRSATPLEVRFLRTKFQQNPERNGQCKLE